MHPDSSPQPTPPPAPDRIPWVRVGYVGGALLLALLLVTLPPTVGAGLFGLLVLAWLAALLALLRQHWPHSTQRTRLIATRATLRGLPMTILSRLSSGTQRAVLWIIARIRAIPAMALGGAAALLLLLSALAFRPRFSGPSTDDATTAAAFFLLGILLLGWALIKAPDALRPFVPRPAMLTVQRTRWRLYAAGVGLLAVAALANLEELPALRAMSHHIQFALLCGGFALVVWGLSGGLRGYPRPRLARWELWALFGLTALALGLRLWGLDDTLRVPVDEMHFTNAAARFWQYPNVGLLWPFSNLSPFASIYMYWQSWTIGLFGRTWTGFRAASSILGALTIPATYLLARTLFDRWTALLAAAFLLMLPPHLHFSRVGIIQIADPFFGTLALAFLARGVKEGERFDYALGGALLGLTQYFYEGGRLFFPVLAVVWLGGGLLLWPSRRGALRGLLLAALAAVTIAAPYYFVLTAAGQPLTPRFQASGLGASALGRALAGDGLGDYLFHLRVAFLFYVHQPELGPQYYGGNQPLLLWYVVPFFLLGGGLLLWRWRKPAALPLLWIVLTSLGSSLLVESAASSRYLLVFPAMALLLAVGLRYTLALVWPGEARRWVPYVRAAAVGALLIVLGVAQVSDYFGPHLALYNVQARPGYDGYDAVQRSLNFPPGTQIHIVSDAVFSVRDARDLLAYLTDVPSADDIFVLSQQEFGLEYLYDLPKDVDHAFFLEPDDLRGPRLIAQFFDPEPPVASPYDLPPGKGLLLYYAPR